MLKKFNDDNELVGIFIKILRRANEQLNEYPPIVERVLVILCAKYLAFGIPIPTIIPTQEIAKALSSPGHEVTDLSLYVTLSTLSFSMIFTHNI